MSPVLQLVSDPPPAGITKAVAVPRESREYFRLLTENSSDITTILEADGRIRYESPSVERVLGFKPEERIGTHIGEYVHPDDSAAARESIETSARAPGSVVTFELRVRHKAGGWRTLEIAGTNHLDDPRVRGLVGNARDVTERKQAEADLRESEERYRNLVELSPESIAVQSEGRVVYINPAGARLFGAESAEALLGKPIFDFVHPGLREAVVARDRQAQDDGKPTALVQLKLLRLDGEAFTAEVIGIPVTYMGKPARQVVIRDITDRLRAEAEVRRLYSELVLAYETTLEGWTAALDLRDEETEGHTRRVTEMTLRVARAMGFDEAELVQIRRGALLHDIGKMGIPDAILLKPGKLSEEEWQIMRRHPVYALELLSPIAYLRPALDIPYCHHEKWDGTGYPRGLQGEEIPLAARLFAVVDVWDALRSDRPYRQGWPEERVLEHIRSLSGTHFDPAAVEVFLRVVREVKLP
jgi:PAS domain S-box-containing protein